MSEELGVVIKQMQSKIKAQLLQTKANANLDQPLKASSLTNYLNAIVHLIMILAKDVVNYETVSMKKMEEILQKADTLLSKTCTDSPNKEQDFYKQTMEDIALIDQDLKIKFKEVLQEKLEIYKDIKVIHGSVFKEIQSVFSEHLLKVQTDNKTYNNLIQTQLDQFDTKLKEQRSQIFQQLTGILVDAEQKSQLMNELVLQLKKTHSLIEKTATNLKEAGNSIVISLKKNNENMQHQQDLLKAKNKIVATSIQNIGQVSQQLEKTNSSFENNVKQMDNMATNLKEAGDSIVISLKKNGENMQHQQDQLKDKNSVVDKSIQEISSVSQQLQKTNSSFENNVKQMDEMAAQVEKIQSVSKQLENNIQTADNKFKADASTLQNEIQYLKKGTILHHEGLEQIGNISDDLNKNIDDLTQFRETIKKYIENSNTKVDQTVSKLDETNQALANKVEQIQSNKIDMAKQIQGITNVSGDLTNANTALQKNIKQIDDSSTQLVTDVNDIKSVSNQLKQTNDALQKHIKTIDSTSEQLNVQKTELESKIQNIDSVSAQLIANEVEGIKEISKELQSTKKDIQSAITTLDSQTKDVIKNVSQAQNNIQVGVDAQKKIVQEIQNALQNLGQIKDKNYLQSSYSTEKQRYLVEQDTDLIKQFLQKESSTLQKQYNEFVQKSLKDIENLTAQKIDTNLTKFKTELDSKFEKYNAYHKQTEASYQKAGDLVTQLSKVYNQLTNFNINQDEVSHKIQTIVIDSVNSFFQNVAPSALEAYNLSIQNLQTSILNYNQLNQQALNQFEDNKQKLQQSYDDYLQAEKQFKFKQTQLDQVKIMQTTFYQQLEQDKQHKKQLSETIKNHYNDIHKLEEQKNDLFKEYQDKKMNLLQEYTKQNEQNIILKKQISEQKHELDRITQQVADQKESFYKLKTDENALRTKLTTQDQDLKDLKNQQQALKEKIQEQEISFQEQTKKLNHYFEKTQKLQSESFQLEETIAKQLQTLKNYNQKLLKTEQELNEIKLDVLKQINTKKQIQDIVQQQQQQQQQTNKRTYKTLQKELISEEKKNLDNFNQPSSKSFQSDLVQNSILKPNKLQQQTSSKSVQNDFVQNSILKPNESQQQTSSQSIQIKRNPTVTQIQIPDQFNKKSSVIMQNQSTQQQNKQDSLFQKVYRPAQVQENITKKLNDFDAPDVHISGQGESLEQVTSSIVKYIQEEEDKPQSNDKVLLYSCLAIFGISAASVVGYKLRKKLRKKFENYE